MTEELVLLLLWQYQDIPNLNAQILPKKITTNFLQDARDYMASKKANMVTNTTQALIGNLILWIDL